MNEPLWIRAAAVAAALAGLDPDEAAAWFEPDDAASLRRAMNALAAGEREARARALVRERARLGRPSPDLAVGVGNSELGARVAAAMLRGLAPSERVAVARALDPGLLRATSVLISLAPSCDAHALLAYFARATTLLGRSLTAEELGALAAAAHGADATAPTFVHRVLRSARARGARPSADFAPFIDTKGGDA